MKGNCFSSNASQLRSGYPSTLLNEEDGPASGVVVVPARGYAAAFPKTNDGYPPHHHHHCDASSDASCSFSSPMYPFAPEKDATDAEEAEDMKEKTITDPSVFSTSAAVSLLSSLTSVTATGYREANTATHDDNVMNTTTISHGGSERVDEDGPVEDFEADTSFPSTSSTSSFPSSIFLGSSREQNSNRRGTSKGSKGSKGSDGGSTNHPTRTQPPSVASTASVTSLPAATTTDADAHPTTLIIPASTSHTIQPGNRHTTAFGTVSSLFSTNPHILRTISSNSSTVDVEGSLALQGSGGGPAKAHLALGGQPHQQQRHQQQQGKQGPPLMLTMVAELKQKKFILPKLPALYQRASRLLARLLLLSGGGNEEGWKAHATPPEDDDVGVLGLDDFFTAFFVDEEWFTKEALVHSLCLVNRLTATYPDWWHCDENDNDEESKSATTPTPPVVVMPSERCEGDVVAAADATPPPAHADSSAETAEGGQEGSSRKSGGRQSGSKCTAPFFTRASLPRSLLALLLLSTKFVDDITYNTESICRVMARVRERQRERREWENRELQYQREWQQQQEGSETGEEEAGMSAWDEAGLDSTTSPSSPLSGAVQRKGQLTRMTSRRSSGCHTNNTKRARKKNENSGASTPSPISSCASLSSFGAASSTASSSNLSMFTHAAGRSTVPLYGVLVPARLGQCEQRMFKSLDHSVWVRLPEFQACKAAMDQL